MIADKKKVRSMINVVGQEAEKIRASVQRMKEISAAFDTVNPDTTGTPLSGSEALVSNSISALDAEVGKDVWTGMIAAVVPSHPNDLL